MKNVLSVAEGLIFRENRIVLPDALQRKVVKLRHKLGHLGRTKTKQTLRQKYWFPLMNSMIDTTIHHNKKDGGMLIVKTVLCEFALAACNDS